MIFSLFTKKRADASTFEELVAPHVEQLYRLAHRYTRNQSDAEDLIQDLLIKLYSRTEELEKVGQLRPWLAKSLYYLYVDQYRAQKRSPIEFRQEHHPEEYTDGTLQSELSPKRQDTIRDLHAAIEQLNEEQRILILMHDVEAYTLAELETILDTPIGTLKSRLHRSRAKLRKILAPKMEPFPSTKRDCT